MKPWDLSPPKHSELGDHDVRPFGQHLAGKRVALMVSGGIAAIKAPFIARALRKHGADVVAYCSREALRYTTEDALEWSTTNPVVGTRWETRTGVISSPPTSTGFSSSISTSLRTGE